MRKTLHDLRLFVFGGRELCPVDVAADPWLYPVDLEFTLRCSRHYAPQDADGIPMRRYPRVGPQYNPTRIASYGLAHWNRFRQTGDESSRVLFLKTADWFLSSPDALWRYRFDVRGVRAPWVSCMAQGEGISVLTRAYVLTGDVRYLDHAERATEPFHRPIEDGGVRSVLGNGDVFFEEYPETTPVHVLNGFLYSVIGLLDLRRAPRPSAADGLLAVAEKTLAANVHRWDLGGWSAYDLENEGGAGPRNYCTVGYHRLHATQLAHVGRELGCAALCETAERWRAQAGSLPLRLRALAGKVRFRARRGGTRGKVCHLSVVHGPHDVRILRKECSTLAAAGHDVRFVVPHDTDETLGGVRIEALPRPRSRLGRMTRTAWRAYRKAVESGARVCQFHDPELIPAGLLLKLRGRRVVYDVHEDLPRQILSKPWIHSWLRRPAGAAAAVVESIAARLLDGVVAATPAIARRFPRKRTVTVQNFPLRGELAPSAARPFAERSPVAVYVGGITAIRGIREMVGAMAELTGDLGARLICAGEFDPPDLAREVERLPGSDRVEFLGWRSREEVAELLGRARMGLVLFHPHPNHTAAQPNKLFEYMSAAIPVVASDFPLWREIVEGAKCGLLANPLDPAAIAEAMERLFRNPCEAEAMGRRGRQAVEQRYNWAGEANKLLELYEGLMR